MLFLKLPGGNSYEAHHIFRFKKANVHDKDVTFTTAFNPNQKIIRIGQLEVGDKNIITF